MPDDTFLIEADGHSVEYKAKKLGFEKLDPRLGRTWQSGCFQLQQFEPNHRQHFQKYLSNTYSRKEENKVKGNGGDSQLPSCLRLYIEREKTNTTRSQAL